MLIEVLRVATRPDSYALSINGFRVAGPKVPDDKTTISWNVDRDVFTSLLMRALKVANADGSYT
jgi:hypothetical protein